MSTDNPIQNWVDSVKTAPDYLTMVQYVADGITDTYEFNFPGKYLKREDIKAEYIDKVNGVRQTLTVSFISDTSVKLAPAQPEGVQVTIFRDTPKDVPVVSFSDGAVQTARNLDTLARQCIFAVAEMLDRFSIVYDQVDLAEMYAKAAKESADQSYNNAAFVNDIYQKFKLTDEMLAQINASVNVATAAAASSSVDADKALDAAGRAEIAAITAVGAGRLYGTPAELQQAINDGKIPEGEVGFVMEGTTQVFAYPYRNVGGTPVAVVDSGGVHRGTLSSIYAEETRKRTDSIENRTQGTATFAATEGKTWVDDRGKSLMAINPDGTKRLFGYTAADLLELLGKLLLGGTTFLPADDSPFIWGIADENNKIIFGIRRRDLKIIYLGEEWNSGGSGPDPEPEPVLPVLSTARSINTVFYLGDSITANGQSTNNTLNALSWPAWADLLSNGVIQYDGQGATGGYTVTQIRAEHLPKALAQKSEFCVLMMGRNDVFQLRDVENTTMPDFLYIVKTLIAANITPVICTMSAHGVTATPIPAEQEIRRGKLNKYYRAVARKYKLPLVDLNRVTTNPLTGAWWDGWSADVSHPTVIGARGMADELTRVLVDWLQPTEPRSADYVSVPATSDNLIVNPLFVDNSGWTGPTINSAPREGFKGNAMYLPPGGAILSQTVDVQVGKMYALSFRIESPTGSQVAAYANYIGGANNLAGLRSFNGVIEKPMTFYRDGIATSPQIQVMFSNQGTAPVYIGQVGLFSVFNPQDV